MAGGDDAAIKAFASSFRVAELGWDGACGERLTSAAAERPTADTADAGDGSPKLLLPELGGCLVLGEPWLLTGASGCCEPCLLSPGGAAESPVRLATGDRPGEAARLDELTLERKSDARFVLAGGGGRASGGGALPELEAGEDKLLRKSWALPDIEGSAHRGQVRVPAGGHRGRQRSQRVLGFQDVTVIYLITVCLSCVLGSNRGVEMRAAPGVNGELTRLKGNLVVLSD